MKDEVEKQKDEVRNMTMILQNPDLLNHSVNGVNGENSIENGTANILDELQHENNGVGTNSNQNLSLMNIPTHNTSLLNTSARGLNTTINFLKSTYILTKSAKENNKGRR